MSVRPIAQVKPSELLLHNTSTMCINSMHSEKLLYVLCNLHLHVLPPKLIENSEEIWYL